MKTVLFVCVHNAGRSQMAEALLNRIASDRSLPIRALSAGTIAGERVNPMAAQAMAEIGVPMDGQAPKPLSQEMANSADRILTMGCGVEAGACPAKFLITEDWGLDDPAGEPIERVREIRDQIRDRVETLIAELTYEIDREGETA